MELANTQSTEANPGIGRDLASNPMLRQLGVMVGIAASVALGVAVVLWSQTPNYSLLNASLAQKDAAEVMQLLQQAGIEYRVEPNSGAVMVPTADVQRARMKLASAGLPRSNGMGFELLQQETGFGTSRQMEQVRFQRALEGELSRTIETLANIEFVRVHLAMPKQSVFVRKRRHPSASVVLKLYAGRQLEQGQVDAIVHLVASSIPELTPSRVTVVDHKGHLLSGREGSGGLAQSAQQLRYTRELEAQYKQRIEDILAPVLGEEHVRAEVTADLDFTVSEQTQERYNPDLPALRSEQIDEQQSRSGSVQGIPGALSNQPPGGGVAPAQAGGTNPGQDNAEPVNISKRATRNYELDRTVSHTRQTTGALRRLSIAVVVDDRYLDDGSGGIRRQPRTEEELSRIRSLVRDAVGYNAQRGDSVQVINSTFHVPAPPEPLPQPAFWEQPWLWDLLRQAGGVLLVLVLIFAVLRPTLRRLTARPVTAEAESEAALAGVKTQALSGPESTTDNLLAMDAGGQAALTADGKIQLAAPEQYENVVEAAREMVSKDPKRVVQVVNQWLGEEGD